TAERATLIGFGDIGPDEKLTYRVPLPPGLNGVRGSRALTVTLAWLTPIQPGTARYRAVALSCNPGGDEAYSLAVKRVQEQPDHHAIERGTVFHERCDGDAAAPFVDGGDLVLDVVCRPLAGGRHEPIPFGLAVSLEVGQEVGIDVYAQVRQQLAVRIPIAAP
ncbi:MAG: hypothetical protein NZ523_09065, partial [Elioraea sp.]|nr:hypothetical protein [Elioraea sp.]